MSQLLQTIGALTLVLPFGLAAYVGWRRNRARVPASAIPPVPEHVRTIEYYHATGELYRIGAEYVVVFKRFGAKYWPEFVRGRVNACRCNEHGSVDDFRPVIVGFAGQSAFEVAEHYAQHFWGSGA